MGQRSDLGSKLEQIIGRNVYFQPPPNSMIKYPAIIYRLATIDTNHANNLPYTWRKRYTVTLIDTNPDSSYVDKILSLPTCSFDRFFVSENLNHWVFVIYDSYLKED